jgi:hypothetical protein
LLSCPFWHIFSQGLRAGAEDGVRMAEQGTASPYVYHTGAVLSWTKKMARPRDRLGRDRDKNKKK